jgi:NADP-dependent 3-hydroxy acid dehydrogenase YdfG/Flp pilus assembly protein TadD
MSTTTIALAYSIDNFKIAEAIDNQLSSSSPYRFEHFYSKKTTNEPPLAERLSSFNGPILMIISDNFLKSPQCMSKGLSLLQNQGAQIMPIITEGHAKDEETGQIVAISTNFDRVSDIIQYINYWQNQYLDLRKQKRQLQGLDEENFNAYVKMMREISSEAGEFLRLLRTKEYMNYTQFSSNYFERFFRFVKDYPHGWEKYRQEAQSRPPAQVSPEMSEHAPRPGEFADAPMEVAPEEAPPSEHTPAPASEQPLGVMEEEAQQEPEVEMEVTPEEPVAETPPTDDDETLETEETPALEEEEISSETEAPEHPSASGAETEPEFGGAVREIAEKAAVYLAANDIAGARAALQEGIESNPDNAFLRYRLALLLAQDKATVAEAMRHLHEILEKNPSHAQASHLLGKLAELQGDFNLARECYENALRLSPDLPDVHYRLGIVLANHFAGEEKYATRCFKQAFKNDENNVDALYQYALLKGEAMGKFEKAVIYLERVTEKQPDHPFAHYDLALFTRRLGDHERALAHYLRAVDINPELRTAENDQAFSAIPVGEAPEKTAETDIPLKEEEKEEAPAAQPEPAPAAAQNGSSPFEGDDNPIEALKKNIKRLEEMLLNLSAKPEKIIVDKNEGKIAMITGATSGIGRATAKEFAENGYRLILTGRRQERLDRLKEVFQDNYHVEIKTLCFDIRDRQAIEEVFRALPFEWRQVDVLVNNAGKAKGLDPIHRGRLDHWEEMIDTNLKGLLYITRAVAQYMVRRRYGHIINVSSTAGKEVYSKGNVYCATKFAVDALTKAMRIDLLKYNIRVSQVSPGHVEQTEFAEVRFDGNEEKARIYDDFVPLNARDVAETIYFIASRARHVNILDVVLTGTQQAGSSELDKRGRHMLDYFIERIKGD